MQIVVASSITSRPIAHIWKGRVARGKLTLIGGDPGAGKGTIGIDFAMRLTTGAPWPDGGQAPLGRILLLTPEDDPEDTIKPRLEVAGADCSRVGFLGKIPDADGTPRRISLDTDAEMVIATAASRGYDVVLVDPVSSYLGGSTDSHRDPDMRRVLDPLAEAAARHQVAVVLVAHLNKGEASKSMYRFLGSIATIAACRFAFLIGPHPDDPGLRVMAAVKNNLGQKAPSLVFKITGKFHAAVDDEIGRVEWSGVSPLTADELLVATAGGRGGQAVERAKEFLQDYLAAGVAYSDDVKAAARERGVGVSHALWEAKSALAIEARKDGLGRWTWRLPDPASAESTAGEEGNAWTLR